MENENPKNNRSYRCKLEGYKGKTAVISLEGNYLERKGFSRLEDETLRFRIEISHLYNSKPDENGRYHKIPRNDLPEPGSEVRVSGRTVNAAIRKYLEKTNQTRELSNQNNPSEDEIARILSNE